MTGFWKMDGRMLVRLAEHACAKGDVEVLDLVVEAFEKRFVREAARKGRTPTQVRKCLRKVRRMQNVIGVAPVDHGSIPRREAERMEANPAAAVVPAAVVPAAVVPAAVVPAAVVTRPLRIRRKAVSGGIESRLANFGVLCIFCSENRPIAGDAICYQCA